MGEPGELGENAIQRHNILCTKVFAANKAKTSTLRGLLLNIQIYKNSNCV